MQILRQASSFTLAILVAAIASAEAQPAKPASPRRPQPHIPGAIVLSPCDVQLSMKLDAQPDGTTRVTVTATNRTKAAVSISAPGRCPAGAVQFGGLGDGYDYDGACVRGACVTDPPLALALPVGGAADVGQIELSAKASSCTKEVAPGTYHLTAHLPSATPRVCDAAATWIVPGPAPSKPPAKAPAKAPPKAPAKHAQCKPMPACGLACPGPFAHDANGCTECACERIEPPATIQR